MVLVTLGVLVIGYVSVSGTTWWKRAFGRGEKLDMQLISSGHGSVEQLRSLISRGADVNASMRRAMGSPLIMAAAGGKAENIKLLIEHGAEVDAQDFFGRTALMYAIQHKECVEALLAAGCDVSIVDRQGNTAIDHAADDPELARLLLEHWTPDTDAKPVR